ncbi:tRNA 2-thiouridine(34) synthase MnmA [Telmatocola sphagniphila]|uniref:tRNA-specific 2-thiouridylase MnmA n=1 Tax=Telmatocola sphagniphila TaxID=1123043 RepID=A0A8E6EWZ7_9BACT|nr:tRNA 2-thiouridine(34) synthase MnmA [Telmatocola sphagniphila]QVL31103.1 tRNA 2-thiouridine(34) synthase MnmA [Telmatocola sphagniphila]
MKKVVLAMSGGVDSSASAVLLKRQGYEVVGLFMRTGVHATETDCRPDNKKGCCSAIDSNDARRVADKLDIPFYALDFEREFDQIIDYFTDEYLRGRTPNPCVVCNNWLKFGKLWEFGKQLNADFIATGHYAQVLRDGSGNAELHRGVDPDKDQSYVLHGIKKEVLDHLLFPVGGYKKPEIREIAREAGLVRVADKPDSVEICFVPDGDHAALIRRRRPELATAGQVVDTDGAILGEHDGYERFTIGQRKGLGIATDRKRFVLEIIPESKTVVLGDRENLLSVGLLGKEINWLCPVPLNEPMRCAAKIRYRHSAVPATVRAGEDGTVTVDFEEPQSAVTPGQAVVFYDGNRVLGGGWIDSRY